MRRGRTLYIPLTRYPSHILAALVYEEEEDTIEPTTQTTTTKEEVDKSKVEDG
jgi:hypothetical protein